MSQLYDDTAPVRHMGKVWRATFSRDVGSLTDRAYVVLPDLDPSLVIGPCRWQSRDEVSLPARGDDALVIFDNDNEPWITAWWPYSS